MKEKGVMAMGAQSPRGWSVDGWIGFWGNPSAEVALRRIPKVVTPDVTGPDGQRFEGIRTDRFRLRDRWPRA
jgi:hypothetical protein